jgi:hypothetical protein
MMMIGMGMPISQSRTERMVSPDVVPGKTHIRRQAFLVHRTAAEEQAGKGS